MEKLDAESGQNIPVAYKFKPVAQKVDAKDWVFFEVYTFGEDKKFKNLVYRSEQCAINENPTWNEFTLLVSWTITIDTPVKIKCLNFKRGIVTTVGSAITSLRELNFGNATLKLHNKKKASIIPFYKSSGNFTITSATPVNQNTTNPATGYKIKCTITEYPVYRDETPKGNFLDIRSKPWDTTNEVVIYHMPGGKRLEYEITIPFEAVHTLDTKLQFSFYKGSFHASLRELTFPAAKFGFLKTKYKKRKHSGILEVRGVSAFNKFIKGYTVTMNAIDVDPMDGLNEKSDPFLMISVMKNNSKFVLYSSETCAQTLNPEFKPFTIDVTTIGDWDNVPLQFEVWDYDPHSQHDFIGMAICTLRELTWKKQMPLINQFKKEKLTNYLNSGTLVMQEILPLFSTEIIVPPLGLMLEQSVFIV